jgi:epoxyqueuosine reductase
MAYLHRHVDLRCDPARLLPGARSVLVAALNYHQRRPDPPRAPAGRVAMYAWGRDYHRVIKDKLHAVIDQLRARLTEPFEARACVDTAPLLERELAMQAGIGWIGKNTLVLHEELGSYLFLGEIVTTLPLVPDAPAIDHCGSCTRCLEACPTDAFPAPYEMDARRCIAYHTIERRSDIPSDFHSAIGEWLFGCDICQEVCPFNRGAPVTSEQQLTSGPLRSALPLAEVAAWSPQDYQTALRGSAIKRARLDMLQRNARIVAANLPTQAASD